MAGGLKPRQKALFFGPPGCGKTLAAQVLDGLPEPQDLASEAITELEAVVDDLRDIISLIEMNEDAAVESA